jgi:hypothetical protein
LMLASNRQYAPSAKNARLAGQHGVLPL